MDFLPDLMPLETALTQMRHVLLPLTAVKRCRELLLAASSRPMLLLRCSWLLDNSAPWDGYVVRMADLSADVAVRRRQSICRSALPGRVACGHLHSHMTGAPVPTGCEAVVGARRFEQTDDGARFYRRYRCDKHRRRGEDARRDAVLPAGTRPTTAELPVLASLGIADAQAVRKCAKRCSRPATSPASASRWRRTNL